MSKTLFTNAVIHTGRTESEVFGSMLTENGVIRELYPVQKATVHNKNTKVVDLNGQHVYPCLIDAHVHMLLTVAVMAMGFNICEITDTRIPTAAILNIRLTSTLYPPFI